MSSASPGALWQRGDVATELVDSYFKLHETAIFGGVKGSEAVPDA